ncbi:acetylcholine receptor subunit alpha-type acr-16-like isoform X2 [Haliotis asinina]|uniref:acetylcholine receptor subunit alpha-type acr-16-like isoform X2 n=1 Tax=Haliotis asinina TaxID=109174 RepID=UPI003531C4F1
MLDGTTTLLLILGALLILVQDSSQGENERRLLRHLFEDTNYNSLERPVANETHPVNVSLGIILQQIIDVEERKQILHSNIWLKVIWYDVNLVWIPEDFGNVTAVRVPTKKIWRPDILMYNSADEKFDGTFHTNIIISYDGKCLWVPPGMFKSTCQIDITWFPFDDQKCDLKFGSWTHDGRLLNLVPDNATGGDITNFIRNGEWELIGVPVRRNILEYECCPEFYIDLTFTIHMRRRTLYYGFNIIIPCVLISSMSLLLFILPPDAGEKISLGVTILLSLMVFLLLVAETMPPTSDALPLIGIYFACIMFMCSLSVLFTVIVLNLHHRSSDNHSMPTWIRSLICGWLAWVLRMSRPGQDPLSSRRVVAQRSRLYDVKLEEKSKSLMANVLEMDDDIRMVHSNGLPIKVDDAVQLTGVRHDIISILKELKKITLKIKKDEEETDIKNEWKFAAMVIDRLCFIICVSLTVGSTAGILGSAPHLLA